MPRLLSVSKSPPAAPKVLGQPRSSPFWVRKGQTVYYTVSNFPTAWTIYLGVTKDPNDPKTTEKRIFTTVFMGGKSSNVFAVKVPPDLPAGLYHFFAAPLHLKYYGAVTTKTLIV